VADKQDAFNKMLKTAFIQKFRKSGMSQMEMSRRLNVTPKHVQRMLDPSLGSLSYYLAKGLEELGYRATFKLEARNGGRRENVVVMQSPITEHRQVAANSDLRQLFVCLLREFTSTTQHAPSSLADLGIRDGQSEMAELREEFRQYCCDNTIAYASGDVIQAGMAFAAELLAQDRSTGGAHSKRRRALTAAFQDYVDVWISAAGATAHRKRSTKERPHGPDDPKGSRQSA
jgi:hypothetical protein